MTPELTLTRLPDPRRKSAWGETGLHFAAYAAAACWFGLRADNAWDAAILGMATGAAWMAASRWLALSRALLAATALAGASVLTGTLASGPASSLVRGLGTSQAQILIMTLACLAATVLSFAGWPPRWRRLVSAAHACTWTALAAGSSGLLVRWYESYQAGAHIGHVPISNLYEVFVLFVVILSAFQLRILASESLRGLAPLTSLLPTGAAGFVVWYAMSRGAHQLAPLVPALDSYWMKLHVPLNFVGYGAFCIAAAAGAAWLLAGNRRAAAVLPSRSALDALMYRLIAVGFVAFTIATILGALWAAEAWGGYWSWDPKETWALIVWLNYAAWLHFRLTGAARGAVAAWWAVIGLVVTLFAFLGVNMYLSGLHSYGEL